jgi:hypothetical protein
VEELQRQLSWKRFAEQSIEKQQQQIVDLQQQVEQLQRQLS